MTRPDYKRLSPRIEMTIAAENIRNAISDPIREFGFAHGGQTARPKRIRRRPCTGRVDHRARQIAANAVAHKSEAPAASLVSWASSSSAFAAE